MNHPQKFKDSELYAADVFVHLHDEKIRFNHTSDKRLIWESTRWEIDETDRIIDLARGVSILKAFF